MNLKNIIIFINIIAIIVIGFWVAKDLGVYKTEAELESSASFLLTLSIVLDLLFISKNKEAPTITPDSPETLNNKNTTHDHSQNKIHHMSNIQRIIINYSTRSFILKLFSLIVVTINIYIAYFLKIPTLLLLSIIIIGISWYLDGNMLHTERLHRFLYEYVRTSDQEKVDFNMSTVPFSDRISFSRALRSPYLMRFYVALIFLALFVMNYITFE